MPAHPVSAAPAILPRLLTRYVVGQIDDALWGQLMTLLDNEEDATYQERTALAAFVCDALDDRDAQPLKMPVAAEAHDLLVETRCV